MIPFHGMHVDYLIVSTFTSALILAIPLRPHHLSSTQPLHLPMSTRRSERIAATASKPTQEPIQPARTRKQPIRKSTGGRGRLRLANPGPQHLRLRSSVKHPQDNADSGNNADPEGEGVDGSVDDDDRDITDPARVKRPILSLLSPALVTTWKVNEKHTMCLIFDAVSPARRFKRGMVYDEEVDFPMDTLDGNITETHGPDPGWMPVDPTLVRCVCETLHTLQTY